MTIEGDLQPGEFSGCYSHCSGKFPENLLVATAIEPNFVVKWLTLMFHIWEVRGSNLCHSDWLS